MRRSPTVAAITRFCSSAKSGSASHDVVDGADAVAHEQRDAVVGVLPDEVRGVAGGGELQARKLRVDELGFLQADDVRAASPRATPAGAAAAR